MRFYYWNYMPNLRLSVNTYHLTLDIKSKRGYYGFVAYSNDNDLVFKDNLEDPEKLSDDLFKEIEINRFNEKIIKTLFEVSL